MFTHLYNGGPNTWNAALFPPPADGTMSVTLCRTLSPNIFCVEAFSI